MKEHKRFSWIQALRGGPIEPDTAALSARNRQVGLLTERKQLCFDGDWLDCRFYGPLRLRPGEYRRWQRRLNELAPNMKARLYPAVSAYLNGLFREGKGLAPVSATALRQRLRFFALEARQSAWAVEAGSGEGICLTLWASYTAENGQTVELRIPYNDRIHLFWIEQGRFKP